MDSRTVSEADRARFVRLIELRRAALEHARLARDLARQRRELIGELVADGYSQAEIGREMGVSRQAVQKMLSVG